MSINEKEILNIFTSDDKISNEIIENHDRSFHKIEKYKEFDLEKNWLNFLCKELREKYGLSNFKNTCGLFYNILHIHFHNGFLGIFLLVRFDGVLLY